MLNSITNETTNDSIWDFNFLSGFWNKDTDKFYRIKIEETDGTCQKCTDLANKIFLKSAAVKGENFPPFHPNCHCVAVDKDGNTVVLWSEKIIYSLIKAYGFTEKESELILKAYRLLLKESNKDAMSKREKIHHIFSYLAALCVNYSGEARRWQIVADVPSTETAQNHLIELGMGKYELFLLFEAINNQHTTISKTTNKDFSHELIQFAIFSNNSYLRELFEVVIGDLNALGSYKGDVFSGRMEIDDMNSDVDANNVYHRFFSSNKDFLEIIAEYNDGTSGGKINRINEFLKLFGDGDVEKGYEHIENQLRSIDIGAHYLGNNNGRWSFIAETIADFIPSGNPYADAVIGENDYRVEKDIQRFLDYLQKGMRE